MIYLVLKGIRPATTIGVSNLIDEIEKSTRAKFVNNLKDLLHDLSSNYLIILDKRERHEDYVSHIFRAILSWPNSSLKRFIKGLIMIGTQEEKY